jgi:L-lactate utilization protein LutC
MNAGNRPGIGQSIEPRKNTGYVGSDDDPVRRFREQFTDLGGFFHLVKNPDLCVQTIRRIVLDKSAKRLMVGGSERLDGLNLAFTLKWPGIELFSVSDLTTDSCCEQFFAADIGISGVDYLIAETGTVMIYSKPDQPRSLSLLPPVHIAVAVRQQLVADLFDLFDAPNHLLIDSMPSCITLITGPSKTGDIELKLVTGVHGPGEIHVILIDE